MDDKNLDFSIFHPLDHWPWERRCRELYGGWRRHIHLTWTYRWRPQIEWYLKRPIFFLLCKLGFHDDETWYVRRRKEYSTRCHFCGRKRPTQEDEMFELPPEAEK